MGTTRRRRSTSEQQQLVQRWHESGQSMALFAKQIGVSVNTLRRWVAAAEPQFLEVVEAEPLAPRDFMVHVGEVCIQVPPDFDGQELRRLMAALC